MLQGVRVFPRDAPRSHYPVHRSVCRTVGEEGGEVGLGGGINLCSVHAKAEEPLLSALESSLSSGSLRWLLQQEQQV